MLKQLLVAFTGEIKLMDCTLSSAFAEFVDCNTIGKAVFLRNIGENCCARKELNHEQLFNVEGQLG